mmetsp:Transcript_37971/g.122490  ORF Transcript_37971/g.122490 Transcript_37971/m.122490 type:complete len:184 (+) Transcript_37971:71-622(+)
MRLILLVLFASLRAASSYLAPPPAALTRTRLAVVSSGGAETALPVRARALPCARPTLLRACPRLDGGAAQDSIISFSERALTQIQELREKSGKERACLRMGVRAGGCSGMSYVMDFMEEGEIDEKDTTIDYEQGTIRCVIDPKSLMFLYGLQLDYSDELIGGGFSFANPNAEETCGCGKSFGV